ncbi:hypothetical protein QAD02_015949 [Eretmocerus hayati]|uniref:Uncharacterized protein n=1 Tax=Eretmocerus hayati TaxID=131215 RepID=A0ACC2P9Q8_9HYME|nr:hypothetical protein QAD02_015949 [Eretmocerus hayati]
MYLPWRYFTHTPRKAADHFAAILQLQPTPIYGYTDDFLHPGEPHGAVSGSAPRENAYVPVNDESSNISKSKRDDSPQAVQQKIITLRRHPPENTGCPAKNENLVAAANREDENSLVRLSSVRTAAHRTETGPIKALGKLVAPSVCTRNETVTDVPFSMEPTARDSLPPKRRRWLAGAPGGWWPSGTSDDSSDEEESCRVRGTLPLKKRKIQSTSRTLGASRDSTTHGCEPQSDLLAHGSQQPQEISPILPHGPSDPEPEQGHIIEALNHSFGSLSTWVNASDNEPLLSEDYAAPLTTSSSSAYGSDSEQAAAVHAFTNDIAKAIRPLRAAPAAAHLPSEAEGIPSPSIRQRRRTRAERAARSAAWSKSVAPTPAVLEVIDLVTSDDNDSDCSEVEVLAGAETMLFDIPTYRALCVVFELSRHPDDGAALIRYVQDEVTRGRERIRVSKWRDGEKKKDDMQRRQELLQTEQFVKEVAEALEAKEPQPGPSGMNKRKKAAPKRPSKKRAIAAPVADEPVQFVLIGPPDATASTSEPLPSTSNNRSCRRNQRSRPERAHTNQCSVRCRACLAGNTIGGNCGVVILTGIAKCPQHR